MRAFVTAIVDGAKSGIREGVRDHVFFWVGVMAAVSVLGWLVPDKCWGQFIPGNPPVFAPVKPNAYGPGINADATGRPFSWSVPGGMVPDLTIRVQPNAYGYGLGHDQYGRPAVPADPFTGQSFGFGQGSMAPQGQLDPYAPGLSLSERYELLSK